MSASVAGRPRGGAALDDDRRGARALGPSVWSRRASRGIRAIAVLIVALIIAGRSRAQGIDLRPGESRIKVFPESGPGSPLAEAARPFQEFHDAMVSEPPRVQLYPTLGPSTLYFPCGYTDGIDDPSGEFYASTRQSWTNQGTLAAIQFWRRHPFRR